MLLQEVITQGIIPDYFEIYFEKAVGIYSTGSALGIIVLPIGTQMLLDIYGWRGSLLLLSGLLLHSVPFSALIRFQESEEPKYNKIFDSINATSDGTLEEDFSNIKLQNNVSETFGFALLGRMLFVSRVLVPSLVVGYTLTGWMIYMVSFAISNGASLKEAAIVVTNGGVGILLARAIGVPILHKFMTYKQVLYTSSAIMALSLSFMTVFTSLRGFYVLSVIFGAAIGIFGTEIYISAKFNSEETENIQAMAWCGLADGMASLLSGFVTGKRII